MSPRNKPIESPACLLVTEPQPETLQSIACAIPDKLLETLVPPLFFIRHQRGFARSPFMT
jgi:hypothetical protein